MDTEYKTFNTGDIVRLNTNNPHCNHGCDEDECKYFGKDLKIVKYGNYGVEAIDCTHGWCSGPKEEDLESIKGIENFEF